MGQERKNMEARNVIFQCPFCGSEHRSVNGTGSDVSCCGEVGRCEEFEIDESAPDQFNRETRDE